MSWNLFEVPDSVRDRLARLKTKSDWYVELGKLHVGQTGRLVCDLQETWPLWVEATEHAPSPLRFLFIGEMSVRGGPDPDVGFLGASLVRAISKALRQPESNFLDLFSKTEFAKLSDDYRNEIALLPLLRDCYDQVACHNNAIIFVFA